MKKKEKTTTQTAAKPARLVEKNRSMEELQARHERLKAKTAALEARLAELERTMLQTGSKDAWWRRMFLCSDE